MQGQYVSVRKEGKVGIIEINKPKANTYDHTMVLELGKAIDTVRFDDSIKVGVTTSKVPKFFSAGADINMLKTAEPDYKAMFCLNCQETLSKFESTPKLMIAALSGHTVGGGLEIALAHDIRIMVDDDKAQIGLPEVNLGVLPGTGGTQRLPRLINKSIALDMMVTGRTLTPKEAHHIGLVNYVHAPDQFEAGWMAYAKKIAEGPAKAAGLIKRSVQDGLEMSLAQGLALERELQNRLFISKDAKEGIAAYLEKRQAAFQGA